MYIAIIDDNIANRKHLERLLDRTSDAIMHKTSNLYFEAFGDLETIKKAINRFDLFFVFIEDELNRFQVFEYFLSQNAQDRVTILLSESDDSSDMEIFSEVFHTLHLPLSVPILSDFILSFYEENKTRQHNANMIEVRGKIDTHYLCATDILYAKEVSRLLTITFENGTKLEMDATILDFLSAVDLHTNFIEIQNGLVINQDYIIKKKGQDITLSNGETFKFSISKTKLAKTIREIILPS